MVKIVHTEHEAFFVFFDKKKDIKVELGNLGDTEAADNADFNASIKRHHSWWRG